MDHGTSQEGPTLQVAPGQAVGPQHHLSCHDCGLVFDTSKSLDVHLHYHKENLLSKWGAPSSGAGGGEDNNNVKKARTPVADSTDFQFFDYSENNSAFQRIQRPSYRYQPYSFERVTSSQVQCDKCGFICDPASLAEHEAAAHPFFEFKEFGTKDDPQQQAEILDLDSQKVVPYQPQGEENAWLDRRYFKEENGNQSPDFGSVSTTMSSPTNSEVAPYFDPPQVMQLSSSQLPKFPPPLPKVGGGGGGSWKSNEARRPKTYNCSACNKWFTSSGHLKRHYNTTLHKNAVKQSGSMDPASMPMSSHHHPPPQEEKYHHYQPEPPPPQEEYQDFFQYPNGMPPHTTNFTDPLPSFSQFQSSLSNSSGFPSVGGLLATTQTPQPSLEHHQASATTSIVQPLQPLQLQVQVPVVQEFSQDYKDLSPVDFKDYKTDFKEFREDFKDLRELKQQDLRDLTGPPKAEMETAEVSSSQDQTPQPVVHKCVDCDKTFNKACYLTQHNKSFHSGHKPYKCQRCGKRFPLEYLHLEHLSKHAGDKPYKCEMCPKQFNHKTDLRRHMCLHSGDKPFACDFCGKGFIRKDHMLKHADTHKKKSGLKKAIELVDPRLHLRVM